MFRGAKVALYLTLTKPKLPAAIVSMENAPISSRLAPSFEKYIDAMKAITDAKLTKRKDADDILAKYEKVSYFIHTPVSHVRIKACDNSF